MRLLLTTTIAVLFLAGCGPTGVRGTGGSNTPEEPTVEKKDNELPPQPIEPGMSIVDFEEPHGSNAYFRLSSELDGSGPIVLVFYRGSWCPQCRNQLGELQKYTKEFEMRGARIVAVSSDAPDISEQLAEDEHIDFPLLSDEDLSTIEAYGVRDSDEDFAMPTTLVIAPDGTIVYEKVGENAADRPPVEELLDELDKMDTHELSGDKPDEDAEADDDSSHSPEKAPEPDAEKH